MKWLVLLPIFAQILPIFAQLTPHEIQHLEAAKADCVSDVAEPRDVRRQLAEGRGIRENQLNAHCVALSNEVDQILLDGELPADMKTRREADFADRLEEKHR